jgi:hypothetical protein
MAEEASFHDVDLDSVEDKLVKFNPVATILRNALYVSCPIVIPNAVIFAIVALVLLISLFGLHSGINGPLLQLFFIFLASWHFWPSTSLWPGWSPASRPNYSP